MSKVSDWFSTILHYLKKLAPKYKRVPFYKRRFWTMISDRIGFGYDESVTWDFFYHASKWIYPRLLLFYDKIDEAGSVSFCYEYAVTKIYINDGYKYIEGSGRFADKKIDEKVHKEAVELWKIDVFKMCEAFRDIIQEDEDFDAWDEGYQYYVKQAQAQYNSLKSDKEKRNYWNSFGFSREWYPTIQFTVDDFAQQKRSIGLNLFAKHFNELWW